MTKPTRNRIALISFGFSQISRSSNKTRPLSGLKIPLRVSTLGEEILKDTLLTEISYGGNSSDFSKISKDNFLVGSSVVTVHCVDKDVTKRTYFLT